MNILITGGAGFIGSNLIKYFNLKKIKKLIVVDCFISGKKKYLKKSKLVKIYNIDILNKKKLNSVFNNHKISLIVHLAALGSVVESVEDPIKNFNTNVLSTINILEMSRKYKIKKLIFASTGGAIMGNTPPPVNENSTPNPISPYGASKLACEGYCMAYANSYNLNITVLRFANVIGINSEHKKGVINQLLYSLKNQTTFNIFGDGSSSRDYISVRDLCMGIFLSVKHKNNNKFNLFHLSTGRETTIKELVNVFNNLVDKKIAVKYNKKRNGEVLKNFASSDLAKKELKFLPKITIENELKNILTELKINK
jgi:UDP-glucose 4-epimerase